jgi:predicted NAD/FAD-binding protein
MKIAVVGSGIAGLSAAWALSRTHDVTLFEKADRLGMDAHGLDVDGPEGTARIDVPLRVFFEGFYPNLTALYEMLDIDSAPINYSASFSILGERSYFRYDNHSLGRLALPFLRGRDSYRLPALRLGWEILSFFRKIRRSLDRDIDDRTTLSQYLEQVGHSEQFAQEFLFPAFSGICTCSDEAIRRYPARVILEYLDTGLLLSAVRRVTQGTQEVVRKLAAGVKDTRLATEIVAVRTRPGAVDLLTQSGTSTFDHAVLATQANQSVRILANESEEVLEALKSFRYESSRVIVHRDPRLCPQGGEACWSPVNFIRSGNGQAPMATIWLNAIQSIPGSGHVFQTWNPIIEPDPGLVLRDSVFQRPVVDASSLAGLRRLDQIHRQPDRRVWFCGSYAARGIPLLESATHSALTIAERLGCPRPWNG